MRQVQLDKSEIRLGFFIGDKRHDKALKMRLKDSHGFKNGDGRLIHRLGACGEVAVAKCLNIFWNGSVNTFKNGGDVGKIQVRTRSSARYDLIVREDDPDDDIFVLAISERLPTFFIHGWIYGKQAKREKYVQTYGGREPAYFVPKEKLHRISKLKSMLRL